MVLTIASSVEGEVFLELLTALSARAKVVALVTPQGDLDDRSVQFLSQLSPYLLGEAVTRSWPGALVPEWADALILRRFVYNESVARMLFQSCDDLFGWQDRALPTDLHLLDGAGKVVLGSITSERDAWLDMPLKSWLAMTTSRPVLSSIHVTLDDQASDP